MSDQKNKSETKETAAPAVPTNVSKMVALLKQHPDGLQAVQAAKKIGFLDGVDAQKDKSKYQSIMRKTRSVLRDAVDNNGGSRNDRVGKNVIYKVSA